MESHVSVDTNMEEQMNSMAKAETSAVTPQNEMPTEVQKEAQEDPVAVPSSSVAGKVNESEGVDEPQNDESEELAQVTRSTRLRKYPLRSCKSDGWNEAKMESQESAVVMEDIQDTNMKEQTNSIVEAKTADVIPKNATTTEVRSDVQEDPDEVASSTAAGEANGSRGVDEELAQVKRSTRLRKKTQHFVSEAKHECTVKVDESGVGKRGRGRPPKSKEAAVDHANQVGSSSRSRRGRRKNRVPEIEDQGSEPVAKRAKITSPRQDLEPEVLVQELQNYQQLPEVNLMGDSMEVVEDHVVLMDIKEEEIDEKAIFPNHLLFELAMQQLGIPAAVPVEPILPPSPTPDINQPMIEVKEEVEDQEDVQIDRVVQAQVQQPVAHPASRDADYMNWTVDDMADWAFKVVTTGKDMCRDMIRKELIDGSLMEFFLDDQNRKNLDFPYGPWTKLARAAKEIIDKVLQ